MKQLILATHSFAASRGGFPPAAFWGRPIARKDHSVGIYSLHCAILPYIDQENLYDSINFDLSSGSFILLEDNNLTAATRVVGTLLCPSDTRATSSLPFAANSYRGCTGFGEARLVGDNLTLFNEGVFVPLDDGSSKILPLASISDGLSSTLAFSEKPIGSGATGSDDPFRDWVPYNLSGDDWGADNWLNACSHLARAYVAGAQLDAGGSWMIPGAVYTHFYASAPPNSRVPDCGTSRINNGLGIFACEAIIREAWVLRWPMDQYAGSPQVLTQELGEAWGRGREGRWCRPIDQMACSPFFGPPHKGDCLEHLNASKCKSLRSLLSSPSVAGCAELFGRRVAKGAVGPDRVIFSPVPRRLRSGIRYILEFNSLQKLVAQATVKGFDVSILPRASLGHGERLYPHVRQPVHQCLTDELRTVIASDTRRCSAPTGDSCHNSPDIGSDDRRRCVQHEALTSIFVHQRQPLERAAIGRPIVDKVAGPNIVLELGRLIDAAIGAGPRLRAEFLGFSQPHRPFQPQLDPEPPHAFDIDRPTSPQQ